MRLAVASNFPVKRKVALRWLPHPFFGEPDRGCGNDVVLGPDATNRFGFVLLSSVSYPVL